MRFLALTAFQSAALALITTASIIALYFLKHRRRRMVISSALLWERGLATRPEIGWLNGKSQRTIIVLDTSPTMQARMSDGRTRWQHAVDAAKSLVNRSS